MDIEEEMDKSTDHQNQETHNDATKDITKGIMEFINKTPKAKIDLIIDHSEFMRQMDDCMQNK